MHMTRTGQDVYVADERIVSAGRADVRLLAEEASQSERHRVRVCAHKHLQDRMQEMFIIFTKETYIRPSKHVGKEESLHVLEGSAEYVFFDPDGNVTDVVRLGDYASGRQFYCRIPDSVYHSLIVRSDVVMVHETTEGPFRREDTVFAPWAPDDSDPRAVADYLAQLDAAVSRLAPGR